MITRIRIVNYRCFQQFQCKLKREQIFLGDNGSGKTSLFDALASLREVITIGKPVTEAFPIESLSRWGEWGWQGFDPAAQEFELDVEGNGGEYHYQLTVSHHRKLGTCRVARESLKFNGIELYEFDGKDAHLFRDDPDRPTGPVFPFDWSRSALATIPERDDNQRLTWFRERMRRMFVFAPNPARMAGESAIEVVQPHRDLRDFVGWLRHLRQEAADQDSLLTKALADECLPGFKSWSLKKVSDKVRSLKLNFERYGPRKGGLFTKEYQVGFEELSDGQRQLVVLYAIALLVMAEEATVCLDEPDNFVALRELQPWLRTMSNQAEENHSQFLIASHHPELINQMAADSGIWFSRPDGGDTWAEEFATDDGKILPPAEYIQRGWR